MPAWAQGFSGSSSGSQSFSSIEDMYRFDSKLAQSELNMARSENSRKRQTKAQRQTVRSFLVQASVNLKHSDEDLAKERSKIMAERSNMDPSIFNQLGKFNKDLQNNSDLHHAYDTLYSASNGL